MALLAEAKRLWNKHVHFLQLHYAYILFLCFFFSGCFYFDPNGVRPNYIDALFMMVSTSTCTGLNTVTITDMSTYQQSLIFVSSIFGSSVFISCVIVFVRKHAFEDRFEEIVQYNRKKHEEQDRNRGSRSSDLELGTGGPLTSLGRRFSSISAHRSSDDFHPEIRVVRRPSILEDLSAKQQEEENHRNMDTTSTSSNDLIQQPNAIKNATPEPSPNPSRLATPLQSRRNSLIGSVHPLETDTEESADEVFKKQRSASLNDRRSMQSDDTSNILPNDDDDQGDPNAQTIMFADDIDNQRQQARNMRKRRTADKDGDYAHRNLSALVSKEQLTQEERFNLGGAEYRALHTLSFIVPLYYLCIPVFFSFVFRIYFATSEYGQWVLDTSNGSNNGAVNPWFMSFFTAIAGFNNVGLLPLDDSVVPFQKSPLFLLALAFLILVGNTAFALLLRLIIWVMWVTTPVSRQVHKDSLRFLLDHPRRCFTTLFPSMQTWWLFLILSIITVTELVMFLILDYWLPVVQDIPWGYRVLDGLFQSISTRNAGFSVIDISQVNPGLTIIYVVAMYISVYPVTISMRRTNVYQERSLGIYGSEDDEEPNFTDLDLAERPTFVGLKRSNTLSSIMTTTRGLAKGIKRPDFFVMQQVQRQLSSDLAWIVIGIFLICVIESGQIMSTSPITVFSVIYECVSAFANVGASLGYPGTSTSQTAQYGTLSKLIVICLMYRGRHRGLPAAIDRAVLLPSDQWHEKEREDIQFKRRNTTVSTASPTRGNSSAVFYRSRTM
ncbi:hypothetical protein K450DRAFT_218468 [Umbelopsis ramanniana AG]|uniref:Potassium transport protein n=1 Tax=Umbelopsis ramanniana AG TaxID=1314678 RepID=A0AAD5HH41_UMBRA|nr:uncharacterized protein K450DRAFT_218468 [Umbelopsis ramanniana AG]KAI8584160.1 hypothetical protein K450DRAFT_218468 [Umbelopsis ramanniana AG]